MAGFLSLALVATLAVALVEYGVTGTCIDSMGASDPLMRLFQNFECGKMLEGKSCNQLKDHFKSFVDDLSLCLNGPAPPTTTATTATTAATATTTTTTTTPTTTTTTPLSKPRDCKDLQDRGGSGDRVTDIFPDGENPVSVRCNDEATIFFNRNAIDGDYRKAYAEYENGFGNRSGDYYLGNKALHDLTSKRNYRAVIDLTFENGEVHQVIYDTFKVAGPDDSYRLTVGGFSGDAVNELATSNGQPFTAKDKDNTSYGVVYGIMQGGFWWNSNPAFSWGRLTATNNRNAVFAWDKKRLQSARVSLQNL